LQENWEFVLHIWENVARGRKTEPDPLPRHIGAELWPIAGTVMPLFNVKIDILLDSAIHLVEQQGERTAVALRYKHVEAALAEVLKVGPKAMGAFRARLRHLRNIGLPRLPSPGSGRAIDYSRQQALAMLIAVELEKLGQSPKQAAVLAQSMMRQSPYGQHEGKDCYVGVSEHSAGYTMAYGLDGVTRLLKSAPAVLLLINISACVRRLDAALDRALASG
jgi:hypothetical protein